MQKKQVAILDVGSSKITAIVGEKGINKTFLIKGSYSFGYDGFGSGEFLDIAQLKHTVSLAVDALKKTYTDKLETVYVGVPGEFTEVIVRDSQISFSKKKKITDADVDALFDSAFVMQSTKYTLINRSAVVYELDDFRRLANPVGSQSGILKGKLSFVLCTNYFIDCVKPIVMAVGGVNRVEFISTDLAQALYLVEPDIRDRTAIICDVGYISTTLTIVQGDGVLFKKTFAYGGGYITADITQKYDIDFDVAEKLKRKINLSCITTSEYDVVEDDNGAYYSIEDLKNTIKYSLDDLCEQISIALEESGYILPDYVSLRITGGGIAYLRGAKEHVSSRLNTVVEIVAPTVPLMDKPSESSKLSLLDLALQQI